MAEVRIATVTLNPAVDRVLEAPGFAIGKHASARRVAMYPAGKGINVSRVLALLGRRSIASGFVGRGELSMFEEHLEETGEGHVICQFLKVRNQTRDNITIVDPIEDTETHIRDEGLPVQPEDVARMSSKLSMLAREGTVLSFGGSLPPGVTPDAFAHMIARCQEGGAQIAVDTSEEALRALQGQPLWLAKLNRSELATLADRPTETREQVIEAARGLSESGGGPVKNVLATMGADGAVLITAGVGLFGQVAVHPGRIVSTVGCGDSLLAGVLAGWTGASDWTAALREGLAAATADAVERKAGFVSLDDVEEFRASAMIESVQ